MGRGKGSSSGGGGAGSVGGADKPTTPTYDGVDKGGHLSGDVLMTGSALASERRARLDSFERMDVDELSDHLDSQARRARNYDRAMRLNQVSSATYEFRNNPTQASLDSLTSLLPTNQRELASAPTVVRRILNNAPTIRQRLPKSDTRRSVVGW